MLLLCNTVAAYAWDVVFLKGVYTDDEFNKATKSACLAIDWLATMPASILPRYPVENAGPSYFALAALVKFKITEEISS